jgi:ferrous iron transport protein A
VEEQRLTSLADLPSGARSFVRHLRGGKDFVSRMAALGFTVGVEVKVVQNYRRGPLIALVRDTRVALGRGEALKVLVEEMSHELSTDHRATQ